MKGLGLSGGAAGYIETNSDELKRLRGRPGVIYEVEDLPGRPQYRWDGSKFVALVGSTVDPLTGGIEVFGSDGRLATESPLLPTQFRGGADNPYVSGFSCIGVDPDHGPAGENVSFFVASYGGNGGSLTDSQNLGVNFYAANAGAPIWQVIVTSGGTGATVADGAAITGTVGGGGSGFTGIVRVSGGVITHIDVTSGGTGYTSQPTSFTFAAGAAGSGFAFVVYHQAQGVTINNTVGSNRGVYPGGTYTNIKKCLVFKDNLYVGGVSGANAKVNSCYVKAGGSGYTDGQYAITFTGGGGSGASGIARVIGGAVVAVHVVNQGYGYTGVPVVAGLSVGSGAEFFIQLGARNMIWRVKNYIASISNPATYWEFEPVWQGAYGSDDFIPTALDADALYMYHGEYGSDVAGGQTGIANGPGIYRTQNGTDWEQVFGPVNSATPFASNAGTYTATFRSYGGVRNHIHAVYPDPFNPGHVYMTGGDGGTGTTVWDMGVSYDYGSTWEQLSNNSLQQSVQISADKYFIYFTGDVDHCNVFVMDRDEKIIRACTSTVSDVNCVSAAPRVGSSVLYDGVTTSGSKVLTSATANFTDDDLGRVVTCENFPPGIVFISTVTNGQTVELNVAARGSASGRQFSLGMSRYPFPGGQSWYGKVDPDTGVYYLNSHNGPKKGLIAAAFVMRRAGGQFQLLNPMSWTTGLPYQEVFFLNGYVFMQNNRMPMLKP